MQDTDAPHETDDPTPSAARGVGDGLESEPMGDDLDLGLNAETSNPDDIHCSMVDDHGTTERGEVSVTQAREIMEEISQEGPVVSVDPFQITADRASEQPYGSGSKSISKSNQGGKASGRWKGRKHRKGGSVKVLEIRSSPSQSVKPYDNFADDSSEDNENRSSIKKQAKRAPVAADDPSTARRPSLRGDGERPHGTPSRRLAFAPVPPSELNIRMGTAPNQTPEKYTPSKTVATSNSVTPIQISTTTSVEEELASPIWSLQQTGSITAQVLSIEDESDPTSEYVKEKLSDPAITHYDEEETIEAALERQSALLYGPDDSSEHHDSDKENVPVHERFVPGPSNMTWKLQTPRNCLREPLQTLYSAPSPSMSQSPDIFTTPSAPQELLRARFQAEARQQWQMVIDTNCLLKVESLEALKLLEGIRETRLVIPNTVLRELDYLRKQDDRKARACAALQWIEACMLKMPSWIHVQSSGNNVQVATTPSVSPSFHSGLPSYFTESDIMHPTLHDHVLEYALLLQTMGFGRVSILTDDTTLKIKALAEGLVVDTASDFSDSLLNPYSDRFLYVGSTPIGRSSISRLHQELYDGLSTPGTATSSSKWPTPAGRPTSRPDTPRPSSRANFSTWRKSQPLGLQALLQ